jgi:hypothetical protein
MNAHEQPDAILRVLADLPAMAPSAALDRRVVSRCHALLAHRHTLKTAAARSRPRWAWVDVTMAAAIGLYGVSAAIEAVRLTLAG